MGFALNDNQRLAVSHHQGPMMVLAGPGSGKTMVITHRIAYLIEQCGVKPEHILVITFTKAAALEMEKRFEQISDSRHGQTVNFGTFHAIFFRILQSYYDLQINQLLMDDRKLEVFRDIVRKLHIEYADENEFIADVISEISLMKSELIQIKYYNPTSCSTDIFKKIYGLYEAFKRERKMIDFDDMLVKCYALLKQNKEVLTYWQSRFRYVLIDEFQDINRVQYATTQMLVSPENNLFVVGDDDQSIYSFRGAKPEFLLSFPKDYEQAPCIVLNTNYRSTKHIVQSSKQVIRENKKRYTKDMATHNNLGKHPIIVEAKDSHDEAKQMVHHLLALKKKHQIPLSEIAIIYRTNIQSRAIIDIFLDMHIPFIVRDKAALLFDHWVARDIMAYLRLTYNIKDGEALLRIVNKPKRYVSKAAIAMIKKEYDDVLGGLYQYYQDKQWMIDRIEEMQYHLQCMRKRSTSEMIEYVRKAIGYDQYLQEYAAYRKISVDGLYEILGELSESARLFEQVDAWFAHIEAYREKMEESNKMDLSKDAVTLTTMHASKGLEYRVVWIIGAVEGLLPHQKSNRDKDIEEERRLFYVGMTRAKEHLYISYVNERYHESTKPSRFLTQLCTYLMGDLKVNGMIQHKKFGKGTVLAMDEDTVVVQFKKSKVTLNVKHCMENQLLKVAGEN